MEAAANTLARNYNRVLCYSRYWLTNPIRIRRKMLRGEVFLGFNAKAADREIQRWKERGGILVSYRPDLTQLYEYDALLLCECPFNFRRAPSIFGLGPIVVPIPPVWKYHRELAMKSFKNRGIKALFDLETIIRIVESAPTLTSRSLRSARRKMGTPLSVSALPREYAALTRDIAN